MKIFDTENRLLLEMPEIDRLAGACFHALDLSAADFSYANLSGADFTGCNLSRANFFQARLHRCDFTGANLDLANLAWAKAGDSYFNNVSATVANFSNAALNDVSITEANLKGSNFSWANLAGAIFNGSDISECSFENTYCWNAFFRDTRFVNADFHNALELEVVNLGNRYTLDENGVKSKLLSANVRLGRNSLKGGLNVKFKKSGKRGLKMVLTIE